MGNGPRFLDEEGEQEAARTAPNPASDRTTEAPPLPRGPLLLEPESGAPERLPVDWDPRIIPTPRLATSPAVWVCCGIGVLFASWIGFSLLIFVLGVFHMSAGLGGLATAMIVIGLAMAGYGTALEWRAYRSLESTERLRDILMGNNIPMGTIRAVSLDWAKRVSSEAHIDADSLADSLQAAETAAEVRAVLRSRVTNKLRERSLQIGRRAAIQGSTLVAICPHTALEGLVVSIRSLTMIRQIAMLYGVRPGFAVTIALARQVALTAAGTSAISVVSIGLAEHLFSNLPGVKHIAGALPGAGVAARGLYRLAVITAEACCPIRSQ